MSKRITELDELAASQLEDRDLIEVVDMSESRVDKKNKKLQIGVIAAKVKETIDVGGKEQLMFDSLAALQAFDVTNAEDYPGTGENQKLFIVKEQDQEGFWVIVRDVQAPEIPGRLIKDASNTHMFYNLTWAMKQLGNLRGRNIMGVSAPFATLTERDTHYSGEYAAAMEKGMISFITDELPRTKSLYGGYKSFIDADRKLIYSFGVTGGGVMSYETGTTVMSFEESSAGDLGTMAGLTPDKRFLAVIGIIGTSNTVLRIYNTYTFEIAAQVDLPDGIASGLTFSADGSKVYFAVDNVLYEYNLNYFGQASLSRQVILPASPPETLLLSANGEFIYATNNVRSFSIDQGGGYKITLSNFTSATLARKPVFSQDQSKSITANRLSVNSQEIYTHNGDNFGVTLATIAVQKVIQVKLTNTKVYVLTQVGTAYQINVYNHANGAAITNIPLPHRVEAMEMSKDGTRIVAASYTGAGTSLFIVNTTNDTLTTRGVSHAGHTYAPAIADDNTAVAIPLSSADEGIFVYLLDKDLQMPIAVNGVYQLVSLNPMKWIIPAWASKILPEDVEPGAVDNDARAQIAQINVEMLDEIDFTPPGAVSINLSEYPHSKIIVTANTTFTHNSAGNARTATYYLHNTTGTQWALQYDASWKKFGGNLDGVIPGNTRMILTLVAVPLTADANTTYEIWASTTPETL